MGDAIGAWDLRSQFSSETDDLLPKGQGVGASPGQQPRSASSKSATFLGGGPPAEHSIKEVCAGVPATISVSSVVVHGDLLPGTDGDVRLNSLWQRSDVGIALRPCEAATRQRGSVVPNVRSTTGVGLKVAPDANTL